jgi:NAD(P)-dependent dehydrogenase (short-subunit alcohol dehydrogenase family)
MSGLGYLSGEFVIVTGAARGLGEAIAITLAGERASVAVADLNLPDAQKQAEPRDRSTCPQLE